MQTHALVIMGNELLYVCSLPGGEHAAAQELWFPGVCGARAM